MPKLPDATAFGERPTFPTSQPRQIIGLPSNAGLAGPVRQAAAARAGYAATAGQSARAIAEAAAAFEAAHQRIAARDDAVSRARAIATYSEQSASELRRLQTEADLADPKVWDEYIAGLRTQEQNAIINHKGSPDSTAALAERLAGIRVTFADQAARLRLESQQSLVKSTLGKGINTLVASAYSNPGSVAGLFKSLDAQVADMAPALSPDDERQLMLGGRSQIATAAVESLLDSGAHVDAQRLVDMPGVSETLDAATQTRLRSRIAKQSQAGVNFQSPIGNLLEDRRKAVATFGANSREVKIIDAAIDAESRPKTAINNTLDAFKEYSKQSTDYVTVAQGFAKVEQAAKLDTGAGDVALVFGFMKAIDPTSVVREGEFATAEQTAGIPQQIVTLYNRAISGQRLAPEQRSQIIQATATQFLAMVETQTHRDQVFRHLAQSMQLDPDAVVQSPISQEMIGRARTLAQQAAATPPAPPLPPEDQAILNKGLDRITTEEAARLSPGGKARLRQMINQARGANDGQP